MGSHLVGGEFQSDKYPTTPRGKVPLSVRDPTAQDLLWEYARRRRAVDAEFSTDLETALRQAGYQQRPTPTLAWQPIATAPRDGTRILVALDRHPSPARHAIAQWWSHVEADGCWLTVEEARTVEPTHWMPLPEAPG